MRQLNLTAAERRAMYQSLGRRALYLSPAAFLSPDSFVDLFGGPDVTWALKHNCTLREAGSRALAKDDLDAFEKEEQ